MGIGGNRILHEGAASKRFASGINALARLDQDVLAQPGVRYLLILEGINDIGHAGSSGARIGSRHRGRHHRRTHANDRTRASERNQGHRRYSYAV